jgi:predicted acyl esterase
VKRDPTLVEAAEIYAPDTDFVAVLVDVRPHGRMLNVREGAVRARHVLPNPPAVATPSTTSASTWPRPARYSHPGTGRPHISSSSVPAIEPNPGAGNPLGTDTVDDLRPRDRPFTATTPTRVGSHFR